MEINPQLYIRNIPHCFSQIYTTPICVYSIIYPASAIINSFSYRCNLGCLLLLKECYNEKAYTYIFCIFATIQKSRFLKTQLLSQICMQLLQIFQISISIYLSVIYFPEDSQTNCIIILDLFFNLINKKWQLSVILISFLCVLYVGFTIFHV